VVRIAEFALLAIRLVLAFVFLLAGATKFVDPVGFLKGLRDFGLPMVLARPLVILLPVTELAVAVALIPVVLAWYGGCGALGLLTLFLIAIGIAMARGRKPDCRCFGQLHSAPVGRPTLIRDGVLAAGAAWLVARGRFQTGPEVWTWFGTLNHDEQKLAVLAVCAVGFVFLRQLKRAQPVSESIESQLVMDEEEPWDEQPAPRRRVAPQRPPVAEERDILERPGPQGVGLPVGTLAPEFELPALAGGTRSLQSLRGPGRELLLVFSSPYCEPCKHMAPKLANWAREMQGIVDIAVISRGTARDNLAKLSGFDPARVLLQRGFEVAEAYDCNATPAAVLVDADGRIQSGLSVGAPAIQQVLSSAGKRPTR